MVNQTLGEFLRVVWDRECSVEERMENIREKCRVVLDGDIDVIMSYYGNESYPIADFPFNFLFIDTLRNRSDVSGFSIRDTVKLWMDNLPEGKWANWVVRCCKLLID